ncbi:MAG: methylenetetrahydrofolate reductase [bacterium]
MLDESTESVNSPSRLEQAVRAGHFVVTSELGPPKSVDPDYVRQKTDCLIGHVEAINVTDNQGANVRMCNWATALLIQERGGEPVLQYTTRDRNRLAIQSDLIGAAALGIKNAFVVSGDHITLGLHPMARQVSDVDPMHVLRMVKAMGDPGVLDSGEELRNSPKQPLRPARFFIGAAENPFADPKQFRIMRLAKKIEAGADFIQTQCIFDIERFREFMAEARDRGLHERSAILGGIVLARTVGALNFMKTRVPGISIPDEMVSRMERAKAEKRSEEEGIAIAAELIQQCREIEGVRGVHLITLEREELAEPTLQKAGLLPRPSF